MNIEFFNEFSKLNRKGLKAEAMECMNKFINSFENDVEKELWTKEYLPKMTITKDGRINNEAVFKLFEIVMYPVLLNGYKEKNSYFTKWLIKLDVNSTYFKNKEMSNLYINLSRIGAAIKNFQQLYIDLYKMDSENPEIQDIYFNRRISNLKSSIYIMPSIYIKWKPSYAGMTVEECNEELEDVKILLKLDKKQEYETFLKNYESNLHKYLEKINYSNDNIWDKIKNEYKHL